MNFPLLFSAGKIGSLNVKNRVVMPPMVRNYANTKGEVTAKYEAHIDSIASGGTGLMILEASYISEEGKGFANELGIYDDKLIDGLKRLAKIAHKYDAKIGPQIYHAGRQTHAAITKTQPVAPSPIPCPLGQEMPRELKISEIIDLENKYALASHRALEAGFDFVEIHGAHGYLITQFLSPGSNRRHDKYGGSFENRLRFLKNIILKTRALVGDDFPIIVRLSGEERTEKGLTIVDTVRIARELERLGVNALHISVGNYGSYGEGLMIPPMATLEAPLVKYAAKVKKAVNIPVITVGKIHYPELAEKILKEKKADFVAIGRALLADPLWPEKARKGQAKQINYCISCNQGCISRLFGQLDVQCTVNPRCGFEKELKFHKTTKPKKILTIGGGPAGLYAAQKLAKMGHKVTLLEASRKLGGLLNQAEKTPYRDGISVIKNSLIDKINKSNVTVKLGTPATKKLIDKIKPDIIVNATGSQSALPSIPGIDHKNILLSETLFTKSPKLKKKVIVAGGGCQGAQVADMLAESKHNVTIVEYGDTIAKEMPLDERALLLGRLAKNKVKIHTQTKISRFDENGVMIEKGRGKTKLLADQTVLCFGRSPLQTLIKELKKDYIVYNIGDSVKVRRLNDAIRDAAELCQKIG